MKFKCKRCGTCCTGIPGQVYINKYNVFFISKYLGMTKQEFIDKCCTTYKMGLILKLTTRNNCIFYNDGCAIYPMRPAQCKTYPKGKQWKNEVIICPNWEK